jgi:hypothetical protein
MQKEKSFLLKLKEDRLLIVVSKFRRELEHRLAEVDGYNSCSADFESHVEEQNFD